jgi:pSer/pThr/pTyr-binding forkhead associated (FHA) protein
VATQLDVGRQRSLASGVAGTTPGSLSALTVTGGVTVDAREGLTLRFGRNRPEVDICVGEDDLGVSRLHGLLTCRQNQWWVKVIGRFPARLQDTVMVHRDSDPLPLRTGYTPLFLRGSRGRNHVLELYVAGE